MVFNGYYSMWDKYGVKLSSKIDITTEILVKANLQNEVFDLIWAINAVSQNDKLAANLSYTVMEEIKKFATSLLNHRSFKKYTTAAEVINRADRHYKGDHVMPERFKQRQPKIKNVFNDNNFLRKMSKQKDRNSLTNIDIPMQPAFSDMDDEDIKI